MEREFNKKKITIVFGILFSLIILMGSTYAFFTYSKEAEAFVLTSNKISATFTEGTNSISFSNAYPISDEFALENLDKLTYIDFTVSSEIYDETQAIEYEIFLTEEENNLLSSDYVKVYLTDENNKQVVSPKIYSSLENSSYNSSGKVIYKDNNPGISSKNYRLYVWLDSSYSQNEVSQNFSFKVNLYAYNAENQNLSYVFKNAIEDNTDDTCTPFVEEDGIIYLSGTNDCVDFNYVWYSGKLWRITAIYPDGTMKMITDSAITTIAYGSDYNFYTNETTSSYMYQWLNEDFLDTLYNYQNIIVTDYKWNATSGNGTISYKLPTTVEEGATLVEAPVGLLNSYEYYMSYKNTSYSSGYLSIGYYWWLLNRYSTSSSDVWYVSGGSGSNYSPSGARGGRPSINLKSAIQLSGGSGTKTDPYKIKGDKEEAVVNTTLLSTRTSGEYVKFAGEDYRIVETEVIVDSDTNEEKTITKLNKLDYVRDESDAVITKKFASSVTFGLSTNTQSEDYWDYYLNNTWKTALDDTYEGMLVEGTYYLGRVTSSNLNYKLSICQAASNTVTIKECEKTTSTWTGYVGLPRYGEMFASQQGSGNSTSKDMWLITPYSSSNVCVVYNRGIGDYRGLSYEYGGRPSINLTSEIVITGGKGTPNLPYEIALPETE